MRCCVVVCCDRPSVVPQTGAAYLRARSGFYRFESNLYSAQAAARRSSAAAAADSPGSPPRSAWAFTIEREAVTRPAAGWGAKAAARSSTRPPWGADARQQEDRARHQIAQAPGAAPAGVAPVTAPTSESPAVADVGASDPVGPAPPGARATADRPRPGSRRRPRSTFAPARSKPAPALAGGLDPAASSESAPQQRIGRERVGPEARDQAERARRLPDQRLRVGAGGDGHVAPLAVGDHEQAVIAGEDATVASSASHPGAPRRSKQASCGLTATQAGPRGSDRGAAMLDHRRGGLSARGLRWRQPSRGGA